MWLFNQRLAETTRKLLVLCAVAFALTGCFRPLYGQYGSSQESVLADLSQIEIAPPKDRVEQSIRNELLYNFYGNREGSVQTHLLTMSVKVSAKSLLVQPDREATGSSVVINVTYSLKDIAKDEVVYGGKALAQASYEVRVERFANERAEIDAEDRAAKEVAEQIRAAIVGYFFTQRNG